MTEKRHAENVAYIDAHPDLAGLKLTDEALDEEAWRLYTTPSPQLNGLSPQQALEEGLYSVYVGATKRSIEEEGYRFLEERGANENLGPGQQHSGARNRPVLLSKASGGVLSEKERRDIEFDSQFVYYSKLRYNCNEIEDRLQNFIKDDDNIELGLRLHRWNAMGSNQEDPDREKPNYLAKVFLTFAPYAKVKKFCEIIF